MTVVRLSKQEVEFCKEVGMQRYNSNRAADNPKGTNQDLYPGQSDMCGMFAEFAALKELGHSDLFNYNFFYEQGKFSRMKKEIKDVMINGIEFELRSSLHPNGHLAIKQNDFIVNADTPFVFATVDSTYLKDSNGNRLGTEIRYSYDGGINVTFHGWLTANEVKENGEWQRGYKQWWAKKNQLKAMHELPGIENN